MSVPLKITVLGTGTSQGIPVIQCTCPVCQSNDPRDKRLRCSVLIQSETTTILIDAGPDFRQQLLKHDIKQIDAVFLTHEHNDHVNGLDDLRPYVFQQEEHIPIYALPRVIDEVKKRYHYAFIDHAYPGAPRFAPKTTKHGDQILVGDILVEPFDVLHGNLPILGFKTHAFVYITDAKKIDSASRTICKGADVLIVNALREKEHWSHFCLKESLAFLEEVGPRQAYLTHLSHLMGRHEDVEKNLPRDVAIAYDDLILNC